MTTRISTTPLKALLLAGSSTVLSFAAQAQVLGGGDIEEVVVQGVYVPDEKRNTSEIANTLDAADFERAGDSDIAVALSRVTGLSLFQGKFVFVRGLGERYSSVLLDGSQFPSTDPLRRVVALDLFPTELIGNALIQKTYSPQYPGEFGGGVIDIRTKTVPDEEVLKLSVSADFNTESSLKSGLTYDGPWGEWTGYGGSRRNVPAGLAETPLGGVVDASAAASIPNIWSTNSHDNHPDGSISLSYGNAWDIGERRLGLLTSVNYSAEVVNKNGDRTTYSQSNAGLQPDETIAGEACVAVGLAEEQCGRRSTEQSFELGGILSLGLELSASHELRYVGTVLRQSTKEAIIESGTFADDPEGVRRRTRIDWVESQVWTNQLSGDHLVDLFGGSDYFLETEIDWRANYSRSDRDAPLRRSLDFQYEQNEELFRLSSRAGSNETSYGALDDESIELGLNFKQPVYAFELTFDIIGGATYYDKERSSGFRRFNFAFPGGNTNALRTLSPEEIFAADSLATNGIRLQDNTDPTDFFDASFENKQAYLGLDIQLTDTVRLAAGYRYEDSTQTSDTFDRLSGAPISVVQTGEFWLPSATITYEFAENMQVRAAYSETVSRPDLRELSNAFFLDPDRDRLITGNPELEISEITNYDLRFEWYFGLGESLTAGAFYKDFTKPIERIFGLQGEVPFRTFDNAEGAEIYGFEIEIEKAFDFRELFGWDWLGDRLFTIKANGSLINSSISLEPGNTLSTNLTRRLQGQSDLLANFQFGWEDFSRGEIVNFVVNYTGDRIFEVGINQAPDVIEEPPILFDFVYKRSIFAFGENANPLNISLSIENILNDDFRLVQGGLIFEQYDIGRTVSLGFDYAF